MVRNRRLARVISDASWGEFLRQLEYKCEWYGRTLVKVVKFYPSSKTCSSCNYIMPELPLNIREWSCPKCNATQAMTEISMPLLISEPAGCWS